MSGTCASQRYYTIPSDNRELQLMFSHSFRALNYTIPSDNRELQRTKKDGYISSIIPYQVITGNYNIRCSRYDNLHIIPYQVITGNYNQLLACVFFRFIIPYQVITGNYNIRCSRYDNLHIIPYQVITGNYNKNDNAIHNSHYYTIPSDNRELQRK